MTLFALLLIAHVIADFYLQPYSWIMDKVKHKERSVGLFKHMCVHTLLTGVALLIFHGAYQHALLIALVIIIFSHYAIDIWKTYMGFTTRFFIIDQLAHFCVIVGVSIWLSGIDFQAFKNIVITNFQSKYLLWGIAYTLAYKPLSILIQLILRPYTEQMADKNDHGLQTAGEHIGALERILVITFVLLG